MANDNLKQAKEAKNDEFYTELSEIQAEMSNYTDKFKNKVVYCNCDDPFESNFVKYFLMNFNRLGLKELIATGYKTSPFRGTELNIMDAAYSIRITDTKKYLVGTQSDLDIKGAMYFLTAEKDKIASKLMGNYALDENKDKIQVSVKEKHIDNNGKEKKRTIKQDLYYEAGDFRSDMSIALLEQSDIVVTNPPFSLFREYFTQLMTYKKQFIILGNIHALTYLEFFPFLKNNMVWAGCVSGSKKYRVSDNYAAENPNKVYMENGKKYAKFGNTMWFTNIDHVKRHQLLPLDLGYKYYGHEKMYPKYDNYDAIEVGEISKIPYDYTDIMGVPNSFINKYCPEQFDIIGMPTAGSNKGSLNLNKDYKSYIGYKQDGTKTGRTGSTFGACPVFERNDHKSIYYTNGEKTVQAGNCERIFIRFKKAYISQHPELFGNMEE